MPTMKAIRIHHFGGPEVLQIDDTLIPTEPKDALLVRVFAAGLNPVDHKTREGKFPPVGDQQLPATLGRDISGVVHGTGSDVRNFRAGETIYAMLGPDRGGFAEYVIVKAEEAAPKPVCLNHLEAAAVPLAALTAWQGLFDHGRLAAGQTVLIHGGAGGVGHFAIQFARQRGARVMTTVSGGDREFVQALGADVAIDYHTQRFEDQARNVDLVLDLIGGETQARSWPVLRPGGMLVSTLGEPPQTMARDHHVRGIGYMAKPDGRQLREITELIDAGEVAPIVSAAYPWQDIADAQQYQQQGHARGKVVLELAA
jgi:NADPH:quinone reductase-like Zn-dependent oxidoreductase